LTKNGQVPAKTVRKSPHRFSEKPTDLSAKPADLSVKLTDLSVFSVFTVLVSGAFRPNFPDFYRIFQKPTGSVTSGFRCPAEFLNTGPGWPACSAPRPSENSGQKLESEALSGERNQNAEVESLPRGCLR
jgi:hypothetical protein